MTSPTLSIIIPTYRRESVLLDTIGYLLAITQGCPEFRDLIVVDQTPIHEDATENRLAEWNRQHKIVWIRASPPSITRSMNLGLLRATSDLVMYVDDDIIPDANLLQSHVAAHQAHPDAWAVAGQVIQPWNAPVEAAYAPKGGTLRRYMDFPFNSQKGMFIENLMAGNMTLKRQSVVNLGGFDENFPPPVAARFESEFAKRIVKQGGKIWFEPGASIRHLHVTSGGTRSQGSHLTSALPIHGVGDYYFALRCGRGLERAWYILKKPFREVRTKFHLRHPWYIPVKLIGEMRAVCQAWQLFRTGPNYLRRELIG